MKKWICFGFLAGLSLTAYSFNVDGTRWPTPQTIMYTGIPGTSASGQTWSQALRDAMQEWTDKSVFTFISNPSYVDPCRGDGRNGTDFTATVCGVSYGTNVLAVTRFSIVDNQLGADLTEADIVFNQAVNFDVYDGPIRNDAMDFNRVALHELGHALGLDHQQGGNAPAIMRPTVGNTFTLQADDIAGVAQLYNGFINCPVTLLDFGVVAGSLANGDCTIRQMLGAPDDSFVDVYQLDLKQSATVTFTLNSSTLDSVLILMAGNSQILQIDDDGGSGCNARISRILAAGTYAVLANTYRTATTCGSIVGPYDLTATYVSNTLPVLGRYTSFLGGPVNAVFSGGVTVNNGVTYRNNVTSSQEFDVVGRINIDPAHIGKPGFIIVAAVLQDGQILVKHPSQGFMPYNPQAPLLSIATTKVLGATEPVDILANTVASQLGLNQITVGFLTGYGLTENPAQLYFHEEPISLIVTP